MRFFYVQTKRSPNSATNTTGPLTTPIGKDRIWLKSIIHASNVMQGSLRRIRERSVQISAGGDIKRCSATQTLDSETLLTNAHARAVARHTSQKSETGINTARVSARLRMEQQASM